MQFFFIFYLDASKKVRTQRKQPRRQHGIKVTAHPYKSFGQAFSKACRVEGQRPRRSRRSETPQRILTVKAKIQ